MRWLERYKEKLMRKRLQMIANYIERTYSDEVLPFPTCHCDIAADRIEKILGLERKDGSYIIEIEPFGPFEIPHSWNILKTGEIVDITARQFDPDAPEVEILSPNDSKFWRYIEEEYATPFKPPKPI